MARDGAFIWKKSDDNEHCFNVDRFKIFYIGSTVGSTESRRLLSKISDVRPILEWLRVGMSAPSF